MKIGELEKSLLATYPAEDACEWDHTGLLVGDPEEEIVKVVVALDPTVNNVRYAHESGANVLLTHHPAFLFDNPSDFQPGDSAAVHDGALVFEAARLGVALMNFHTALDFNPEGYSLVPNMLGLHVGDPIEPEAGITIHNGYGALCTPDVDGMTLRELAVRCHEVLGRPVQVWGDINAQIEKIVWGQGSANGLQHAAIANGADCLIAGELKYNPALDLMDAGCSCIVLGHDVSEQPFAKLLYEKALEAGVPADKLLLLERTNWCVL